MRQSSLAGFEKDTNKTRKELFLKDMETIIPWFELPQALEPYYPNPTGPGRHPK
jgi:IS5 family transposase